MKYFYADSKRLKCSSKQCFCTTAVVPVNIQATNVYDFNCFPDEQQNETNTSFRIVGNGALYVVNITVHQPQDCVAGNCINYFPEAEEFD
jgi:hypothetical protein